MSISFLLTASESFTNVDILLATNDFVEANLKSIHLGEMRSAFFITEEGLKLFYSDKKITDINQNVYYTISTREVFDKYDELIF
jgi:hypothetical protein